MLKIKVILALLAINFLFSMKASSQDQATTVSSILDNPVEGQEVTLQGKIIGQQSDKTDYIFTDGTDQIAIEIQSDDFNYSSDIDVQISGVVDFESQHPEEVARDPTSENIQINVNQLQIIK
ncbi:conserved exported hypothetical protein [Hyella patelloides LEGE 07179]|uniref:Uncharacterized protein n=1 Tax=Hyella patelloides LEGE 07179 TaxID=945734 RepID=A0A563VS85_9CYAN|nr:NirD/YgiW/YdeI family stress tolerance protein [Hyella patelloides]VEP14252.1 conserved exported hypothetical protein [Hyella patelloides LEGE 07179]